MPCKIKAKTFLTRCNQGFTLIEILVAITILSFLMVGVYQIVDNSTTTKEIVTTEDRDLLQMETVWSRIDLDLSLLYSPRYFISLPAKKKRKKRADRTSSFSPTKNFPTRAENGMPIPQVDASEQSTLIFMTAAHRRKRADATESTYAWVKYSLQRGEDGEKGSQLMRTYYAHDPYIFEVAWDEVRSHLLLTNVKKLEFLFWSNKKERFVDNTRDLAPEDLIKLIQVNMVWIDNREMEHEVSRTFRPLWPHFDPQADQIQIQQSVSSTSRNTNRRANLADSGDKEGDSE